MTVHVNHLYPRGGDVAGGTPVTVTGRGFIAPAICRFAPRTLSAADVSRLAPVNATVRSSTELVCVAPPCEPPLCNGEAGDIAFVEVAASGGADGTFSRSGQLFTYADLARLASLSGFLQSLEPLGGPRYGGTRVFVGASAGAGARRLGTFGLALEIGSANALVPMQGLQLEATTLADASWPPSPPSMPPSPPPLPCNCCWKTPA